MPTPWEEHQHKGKYIAAERGLYWFGPGYDIRGNNSPDFHGLWIPNGYETDNTSWPGYVACRSGPDDMVHLLRWKGMASSGWEAVDAHSPELQQLVAYFLLLEP